MNIKKTITSFFLLFLITFSFVYSEENYTHNSKGIELCNDIYTFLDKNNFNPETQDLILKGENKFPYNILVTLEAETASDQNIIFTFFQEDILKNQKIIIDFINYVKLKKFDFNTILLFSYGEKETIKKQGIVYGVDSFLQYLNSNDDYTNIIVDLSSKETSIKTSSDGITAPSWLIQNEYNTFIKYNLKAPLPYFYLSQLYTFNFFHDRILNSFFEYEVPSIRLNFEKESINNELVYSILKESINLYSDETTRLWDQHFLMVNLFGQFKKLTEVGTVKIIIFIIFIWLAFILVLIFVNIRMKKQAWATLKHIWYAAPLSYILVYISFVIGKYCSIAFFDNSSNITNVFLLLSTQIILSVIFVSIYYSFTLIYNNSFQERSIDYLIVMSCFVNQSFFILIDVSLFPIFMTVCLLSILALSIKNNGIHILIFFLMVIPFIPYLFSLLRFADFTSLYQFLITENYVPFCISLIIFPFYLIYFRVLTSIKRHTKFNIFIITGITTAILSIIIIIISSLLNYNLKSKEEIKDDFRIYTTTEQLADFSYSDKIVFDDIIRTINIKFEEQPEQCTVNVSSLSSSPILYTENEFEYITPTTSSFTLPSNPPKSLTFTYGASKEPSLITISAIFPTGKELQYKSIKKVVTIGK